jgi:hypothetical protein
MSISIVVVLVAAAIIVEAIDLLGLYHESLLRKYGQKKSWYYSNITNRYQAENYLRTITSRFKV